MGQIINNIGGFAGGQIVNNIAPPAKKPGIIPPYTFHYSLRGFAGGSEERIRRIVPWSILDPTAYVGDTTVGAFAGKGGNAVAINRTNPIAHPTKPWLRCSEIVLVEGKGAWKDNGSGLIAFFDNAPQQGAVLTTNPGGSSQPDGFAIIDTIYRPPSFNVGGDGNAGNTELSRWVNKQTKDAIESQTMPGELFQWQGTNVTIPEAVSILRSVRELTYTWYAVPDSVVAALEDGGEAVTVWDECEGRINAQVFDGYDPLTVLCLAPQKSDLYYSPGGTPVRDVIYHFAARIDGSDWTKYYRKATASYQTVVTVKKNPDGSQNYPYGTAKLDALFLNGQP